MPPFSKPSETARVTSSTHGIAFVPTLNSVITAGSDMCVRWWDLNCGPDSSILISPDKADATLSNGGNQNVPQSQNRNNGEFRFRLIEGVEVIHDLSAGSNNPTRPNVANNNMADGPGTSSGPALHSNSSATCLGNAHHNIITDVATVATPNQSFILTSSSDGVIKVWK